jgi:hypothetical protein
LSNIERKRAPTTNPAARKVELLLFYSFNEIEPLPQGTAVGTSSKCSRTKMDRTGKVVRFDPSALRVIANPQQALFPPKMGFQTAKAPV